MNSFGEIVEPGTRTAWEDWDENIPGSSKNVQLKWQKAVEVPDKIHKFFILEGRQIADTINSLTKHKLELVNVIQNVDVKLYCTDNSDVYICVVRDYDLLLASEIIELLTSYILASQNMMAIMTKPLVEYQTTENTGQEYVLRSLSTCMPLPKSLTCNIPKLEQPNIISGITAGVLNMRQTLNQPGEAFICYMEHNEEYQINELQDLLNQLNFGPVQSQPSSTLNSNLYI